MKSALLLAVVSIAGSARAESLEGTGRITVLPGWRYTPNDTFAEHASDAGHRLARNSPGGFQLTGTFAYAASPAIEVTVDLFGGHESFRLSGLEPVLSVTYGALAGFRGFTVLADKWIANAGLALGPVLVYTSGGAEPRPTERLVTGYAAIAGLTWRAAASLALSADVRWLLARGSVREIGALNGGGVWAGVGVTWWMPVEASRRSPVR